MVGSSGDLSVYCPVWRAISAGPGGEVALLWGSLSRLGSLVRFVACGQLGSLVGLAVCSFSWGGVPASCGWGLLCVLRMGGFAAAREVGMFVVRVGWWIGAVVAGVLAWGVLSVPGGWLAVCPGLPVVSAFAWAVGPSRLSGLLMREALVPVFSRALLVGVA
ncbi:hypothetical protein SAMN02927923_03443 [Microvirga guangxiensis]|uniref:Uncharacterized protein n=1 Tax=Microvirga guangxiensis TaxID=549386 RepID=A0A1G5KLF6_9HYPH|nr:hypothetical protein SAMN02927923_03443 [Microvirga guangxiensis]